MEELCQTELRKKKKKKSFISMPTGPTMQNSGLEQQGITSLASTPGRMVRWSSGQSLREVNPGCQHGNMH